MPILHLFTGKDSKPKEPVMECPILFLHGYEIYANGRLGPLSQAACTAAVRLLEMNRDLRVILLGGWHLKETGAHMTIADAMLFNLVQSGIDRGRIITQAHFRSLDTVMPPRDSWEELIMLRRILARLGISHKAPLTSIAWDFHIPRLKKMYRTYGLTDTEAVPAVPEPYEGLKRRKRMERAARIVRLIDPDGDGIICHWTRLKRTLNEGLKPLIP